MAMLRAVCLRRVLPAYCAVPQYTAAIRAATSVRSLHASTACLSEEKPAEEDAFAKRPPEDEIANRTAYFELLASYWSDKKDAAEILKRVSRLENPHNWVNVLNCFAERKQKAPEVVAHFEKKFVENTAALETLNSHYLAALAYGFAYQQVQNKDVYSAIAGRAKALQSLPASDFDTLQSAFTSAGVTLPAEVKRGEDTA